MIYQGKYNTYMTYKKNALQTMKQVDLEEYGFYFKIRILGLQNTDFEFSNLACLVLSINSALFLQWCS